MLETAKSFKVIDCICRKEQAIACTPCDHSLEVCLSFSKTEGAYDYISRGGRIISKEEDFNLIAQKLQEDNFYGNAEKYALSEAHETMEVVEKV